MTTYEKQIPRVTKFFSMRRHFIQAALIGFTTLVLCLVIQNTASAQTSTASAYLPGPSFFSNGLLFSGDTGEDPDEARVVFTGPITVKKKGRSWGGYFMATSPVENCADAGDRIIFLPGEPPTYKAYQCVKCTVDVEWGCGTVTNTATDHILFCADGYFEMSPSVD